MALNLVHKEKLGQVERKREYDLSLGREFEEEAGGPKTMDAILLEHKTISPEQAKEAREYAERSGLELRDAFVQLKMVEPDQAARAYLTVIARDPEAVRKSLRAPRPHS